MTRLPKIPDDQLSADQRSAIESLTASKRIGVGGPFPALLRSPELCRRFAHLNEYIRFDAPLKPRLLELSILVTAFHWRSNFEWFYHAPLALHEGLPPDAVEAIRVGEEPALTEPEDVAVYAFCTELYTSQRVSDATYARAVGLFGEQAVVEFTALCGFYVSVAMLMNVAKVDLPPGHPLPFPD